MMSGRSLKMQSENKALEFAIIERRLTELAHLNLVEYDRCRQSEADTLGIRVSTLDLEVGKRRPRESVEGAEFEFLTDPEPWPDHVNGNDLVNDLMELFSTYLVLPDHGALVLALWTVHAHCIEAFHHSPRLNIKSAEKNSGKTTGLDLLSDVCPRSLRLDSVTTATLFRLMHEFTPTLLVDEHDSYLKDNEGLRGALNSGHRRGGVFPRCEGQDNKVRLFRVFGATALAGLGNLPSTLAERSIVVEMKKALPGEVKARYDPRNISQEYKRKALRWTADNLPALRGADPEMPEQLFNRCADNWRPLLAIADLASETWGTRARQAAKKLLRDTEDDSARVMLLEDIKVYFTNHGDRIKSDDLVSHLSTLEDRPWPEWTKQKPITVRQVAQLLKPFRIKPEVLRFGKETARGYNVSDFQDAFSRYIPPVSVTPKQPSNDAGFGDSLSVTPQTDVTDGKQRNPLIDAGCDAVTDEQGGERGETRRRRETDGS